MIARHLDRVRSALQPRVLWSGDISAASHCNQRQWLNSAGTDRNGDPAPVSVVPPPGNDVPSPFGGKSLKLLPPEVRFFWPTVLTVALMLQCCVCLSVRLSVCPSVTLCIVAKRCVLEQKLLLKAYRKSYMRNRLVPKSMTLTFV